MRYLRPQGTPRPLQLLKSLLKREGKGDVLITRATTYANRDNLAASFFDTIISRYENTRIGRQELMGEVLLDVQGALWSYDCSRPAASRRRRR